MEKCYDEEKTALHANETWKLTYLPLEEENIGSRWIYTIKFVSNGQIESLKARLVAKGYT